MIRRSLAMLVLVWLLGFGWFALVLPLPHGGSKSDAVVVFTGGEGRIPRGLAGPEHGGVGAAGDERLAYAPRRVGARTKAAGGLSPDP